jgi:putative ABC transport system permease protein
MTTVGRGIRNAFRNATRIVSIVLILGLAIGLAFVMLIAHRTVTDKVASTLSSVGNSVSIGPPGYSAGGLLGTFLTTAELAPIAHLHGVTSLDEYFNGALKASDLPPGGATKTSSTPTIRKIVSGHAISGTSSADVAMVSTAMARKNGLTVGSIFRAYGKRFTVAAIFGTDSQQGNDTIVTSLPVLDRLEGDTGLVFNAVVTAASLTELSAVTSEIENTLGPRASVVSYTADATKAVNSLDSVEGIALYSLAGAVGAAVVILLLVMVMIVRERKREIGILKAIGASNGRIMAQFTTEALTFTLFGFLVGLVASAAAAWMIARVRPAEVLRSE